ncbi:M90 family metallopeptidase [Shewanella cyperi]|uniref:M90 family metallopeptidase n=1 Tax=Shewanella cyperi TaxID=2814292 RepID=UPI001A94F124|nr:M90 family metallopeptidase [Shewanella cyperi]QSX39761.1 zinc-dependent peptidase [Shewanella cyperi]
MLALILVSLAGAIAIGWIVSGRWRSSRRRAAVAARPFPKAWRATLKRRLPLYQTLPPHLQLQLKRHIQVFLSEKQFIGCGGLEITDEIRVAIAAQACLLLLNRKTDFYPGLRQILVYPDAFYVDREHRDDIGLVSEQRHLLAGESWQQGQVLLSWQTLLNDADAPGSGHNLVIHEFAHQLDQEDGIADGAPLLSSITDYPSWSAVLSEEYAALRRCAAEGLPSLFDYYGASNPAEFFAVVSEVFFTRAAEFKLLHPALYHELERFYQLDPASWQ